MEAGEKSHLEAAGSITMGYGPGVDKRGREKRVKLGISVRLSRLTDV